MVNVADNVLYTLTENDAQTVNNRRQNATDYGAGRYGTGYQVHTGETVNAGDVLPLTVVKVHEIDDGGEAVSGQVLLPGSDVLYVAGIEFGDGPGTFDLPSSEA